MITFFVLFCSASLQDSGMHWLCKLCTFSSLKQGQLLKHYRLKHGGFTRTSREHQNTYQNIAMPSSAVLTVCTFKSFNALKVHLSKIQSGHNWRKGSWAHFYLSAVWVQWTMCRTRLSDTFAHPSEIIPKNSVPLHGLWFWDECILNV